MILHPPYGITKPTMGAMVNPLHPFAKDLSFIVPFNEVGCEGPTVLGDTFPQFRSSLINQGNAPTTDRVLWNRGTGIVSPYWTSNKAGRGLAFPVTWGIGYISGKSCNATNKVTVAFVRRNHDTTLRDSAIFNHDDVDGSYFRIRCPHSDGNVYWAFGLVANILSVAVTKTIDVEHWIFIEDPINGPSIWRNGIKIASSATPRTRTADLSLDGIIGNTASQTASDTQDINFFQISNTAWSDEICRWWSAEPYAHLYPDNDFISNFAESPVAPQWRSGLVHSGANSSLWETTGTNTTGITDLNADGLDFGSSLAQNTKKTKWFAFKDAGEITIGSLAPTANAGPNQTVNIFEAQLDGTATPGSYPCAVVFQSWEQVSGPSGVVYNDPTLLDPIVTFTQSGVYVFRLTVTNGADDATDEVQITVTCASPVSVSAGPNQEVLLGIVVQLAGVVTEGPDVSTKLWTKVSGPGNVTFSNSASLNSTATFSAAGVYVLRLSATSVCQVMTDDVTITISGDCTLPSSDPEFDCE